MHDVSRVFHGFLGVYCHMAFFALRRVTTPCEILGGGERRKSNRNGYILYAFFLSFSFSFSFWYFCSFFIDQRREPVVILVYSRFLRRVGEECTPSWNWEGGGDGFICQNIMGAGRG